MSHPRQGTLEFREPSRAARPPEAVRAPVVLVVDDHPENLVAFRALLEPLEQERGAEVLEAADADQALRHVLAAGEALAVILLDVMMPGTDGIETARLIRQRAASEQVPIIFVTALDQDRRQATLGYQSGAVDYLTKPVDPELLRAKVAAFVDLHQRRADALVRERRRIADLHEELSREWLARVIAQFPGAVAILEGRDLIIRATSRAYEEIIGYRDVIGLPFRQVLPELEEQGFFALLDQAFVTGEPVVMRRVPSRWDSNGDGMIEEHVIDLAYQPVRDMRGEVDSLIVFVQDRGAEARAEAALRESEERFRNMADHAPVMLWVTDASGYCTFLNARWREFTGQTLEDGLGRGWLDALHPADRPEAERLFVESHARGLPFRADYRLRRADGEYRWTVDAAAPRLGANGELLGYVGSVVDIEERARLLSAERAARQEAETARAEAERLQAEAEAAGRAKSEFLATMSHEIRTPINAIQGYAQLLDVGVAGPVNEQQRDYISRLTASGQHLLGLVNDVLDLAKVDAGEMTMEREARRTGAAVATALDLTRPLAAGRGITLVDERADAEGQPYVGDEHRVRQILVNLLSNAIKFSESGDVVRVACGMSEQAPSRAHVHGRGPWTCIRVADTGPGIPYAEQEQVFEPFHQVERGHTRTKGGTGLGLAISRRLARLMGGDLVLESQPGVGSTFTLWLPAAGDDEAPERRAARAQRSPDEVAVEGLAETGARLRAAATAIVQGYAARLHADARTPRAHTLPEEQLENHAATFVTDLAQSLVIVGRGGSDAAGLLRDTGAIERAIAETHGVRRFHQGWTQQELKVDYEVLRQELTQAVMTDGAPDAASARHALEVLLNLIDRARDLALVAWRRAAEEQRSS